MGDIDKIRCEIAPERKIEVVNKKRFLLLEPDLLFYSLSINLEELVICVTPFVSYDYEGQRVKKKPSRMNVSSKPNKDIGIQPAF